MHIVILTDTGKPRRSQLENYRLGRPGGLRPHQPTTIEDEIIFPDRRCGGLTNKTPSPAEDDGRLSLHALRRHAGHRL